MGRKPKYITEEDRKAARKQCMADWRKDNPDKVKGYSVEAYKNLKESNPRFWLMEKARTAKKKYYEKNKKKYVENANQWQITNSDKYKIAHKKSVDKYYKKTVILKKIEQMGEMEWLTIATDEEKEIYVEHQVKQQKQ